MLIERVVTWSSLATIIENEISSIEQGLEAPIDVFVFTFFFFFNCPT